MADKVFVTRPIFEETIDALKKETDVRANLEDRVLPKSELIDNVKDVDGVITLVTDSIDRAVLNAAPRLKVCGEFRCRRQ